MLSEMEQEVAAEQLFQHFSPFKENEEYKAGYGVRSHEMASREQTGICLQPAFPTLYAWQTKDRRLIFCMQHHTRIRHVCFKYN